MWIYSGFKEYNTTGNVEQTRSSNIFVGWIGGSFCYFSSSSFISLFLGGWGGWGGGGLCDLKDTLLDTKLSHVEAKCKPCAEEITSTCAFIFGLLT